ncbi:MAG: hypothetical protein WAM60_14985, partial [Candidatus Promineifilaceae bacterium]
MKPADLFLIISFFIIVLVLLGLALSLVFRRWTAFKRLALSIILYIGLYALLLVGFSLASPQKVLAMHEDRCFDDWCASVEHVEVQPAIGETQAQGDYYLVTIQVSSRARRIRQRALDAAVYLLDENNKRFDISPEGEQALERIGQAGMPLNSYLDPGGSFTYTAVFDIPPESTQLNL